MWCTAPGGGCGCSRSDWPVCSSCQCGVLRLNGDMGSPVGEQLWQTLSDSGLALVCVRGPQCRWADLHFPGDGSVGELTWLARDADELAEQYRRDHR